MSYNVLVEYSLLENLLGSLEKRLDSKRNFWRKALSKVPSGKSLDPLKSLGRLLTIATPAKRTVKESARNGENSKI